MILHFMLLPFLYICANVKSLKKISFLYEIAFSIAKKLLFFLGGGVIFKYSMKEKSR